MTEQFKLVTNAQESKIFISNVTAIKIKCSNNFPVRYSVEITYTSLEKSENSFDSPWYGIETETLWIVRGKYAGAKANPTLLIM